MSRDLPEGWFEANLPRVAHLIMGQSPPSSTYNDAGVGLPFFQGKADFGEMYPVPRKYCSNPLKIAEPGDILISVRAPVGPTNICRQRSCIGRGLAAIRPLGEIPGAYVLYYLRSIENWLSRQGTGSTFTAISKKDLEQLAIPLAPADEQKRIVAKLEELLAKVTSCRRRLDRVPVLLKRFRQSVLAAACSGRLTEGWREVRDHQSDAAHLLEKMHRAHEDMGGYKKGNAAQPTEEAHDLREEDLPTGWCLSEMRTLVAPDRPITYGILKPGPDTPGGVQYVRVADFPNDAIDLGGIRRTTKKIESQYARARLREGDVLLSIRGTVGRVCTVPKELEGANITQDTARLSLQEHVMRDLVALFLRAPQTQKRMQKAMKGAAVRGINIGDVRALQLPIPPTNEQEEIVRRVRILLDKTEETGSLLATAMACANGLSSSILSKAFRGDLLVPGTDDSEAVKTATVKKKGLRLAGSQPG